MTFGTLKASFIDSGTAIVATETLTALANLHPVAFSGNYTALLNRPTLGTAAALNTATTLVAGPTEVVLGSDTRLTNSREWQASTITQADAEAGTSTERQAVTAQRMRQASAGWWSTSTSKLKLDTVETGATADQSAPEIASLFAADGTATQSLKLTLGVTSLSSAAFTGSYTDLLNKPTLGTASALSASELRDRATHTGAQAITTVTGLQDALNGKQATGSYATLDQSGKVPALQLPSYVDDVLEVANFGALPGTGETGKIYTTLNDSRIHRWGGSSYIEVSPSPGSTDAVPEGSVNLYYTALRAAAAAPVQSVAGRSGNVVLAASDISGFSTVATSGAYADLSGKPTLGTAAATASTDYATAAQGAKADTAIQPGNAALTDAREWSASTIDQAEAEAGTATTRRAFTAQRAFQAAAAWWAGSSFATKLAGIATGATANSTDATLLARANHTGTQAASTVTGLATVATTGAYSDLSGKPALLALTSTTAPQPLAANSAIGDAPEAARANHVHARPSLPDLGITTGAQTLTVTVAPNARAEVPLTASQVFILHSVTISGAAWVVLYNSSAAAVADTERLQTADPAPGSGVVTEFVTEGAATIKLSPTATVVSGESPASTSYPVKVKNLGAAASVVVTFNFYKLS